MSNNPDTKHALENFHEKLEVEREFFPGSFGIIKDKFGIMK